MNIRKLIYTTLAAATIMLPTTIFAQTYGTVNTETLNTRKEPSTDAANLGQLSKGDEIEILSKDDEWLEIRTEDGVVAYVKEEYVDVDVQEIEGKITGSDVRLRTYPDLNDSEIIKLMDKGDVVQVEYIVGDWCKVTHEDGDEGFVAKRYVEATLMSEAPTQTLEDLDTVEQSEAAESVAAYVEENTAEVSEAEEGEEEEILATEMTLGQTLVEDAMQFLGNRYVYGGNSLTSGVDCSGFTQQMMKRHGISISRTSSSQYASDGYKISKSDLEAGDLVFYGYSGRVSHVAIYIGDGQIIHADTSRTGVIISDLDMSGKPYIGAKRVL